MRLLSEEKKSGTIEIILTLPISETMIVLAKFLASWLFLSFMLALSLTIPLTLASLGDLEIGPVIGSYVGSLLMAGVYLALGLFVSAITKNQIISFVLALSLGFVWWLVGTSFVTESAPVFLASVLQLFSPMSHWQNSLKGLIDTRDLVFYFSLTIFWLYLTILTLSVRRWR